MPAARIHYDGLDRRAAIRAVLAQLGKMAPSQAALGRMLGVSQATVAYHMRKLRENRG
jgi:biotin operon repressor